MAFQSFEELEVWKKGCALAVFVYESLKASSDFGLRNQMQRSAVSVPSNIAEGHERSSKDFLRFLSIAKGSSAELRTQAYNAFKVNATTNEQMNRIVDETKQINRMLTALANSLRKQEIDKPENRKLNEN